ncbi:hypothetical protein CA85_26020 [Allorhodopirellula solitaria]|uniref:Uncharacterized protein n=2 Tax=Allorhodopirellula solitaria TaxID=2527987 RepID=A0A5C5XTB8_9BACT|nr:hypothetical protein CA85_26020 [Allorhodopirellula solitaria]
MMFSNNLQQSVRMLLVCLPVFGLLIPVSKGVAQENSGRQERTAQLDAKVTELQTQLKVLREKLLAVSEQAKSNLRAEVEVTRDAVADTYVELQSTVDVELQNRSRAIDEVWKQMVADGTELNAAAVNELERTRQSWSKAHDELGDSYQQQITYLQGELDSLELQAQAANESLGKKWDDTRFDLYEKYQATARQMRASYREGINELEKEVARLDQVAANASDQVRVKLDGMSESLSKELGTLHEELQNAYQDTTAKTDDYLAVMKREVQQAGADADAEFQAEVEQVSASLCKLQSEMVQGWIGYGEWIDERVADVKQRAQDAEGVVKQELEGQQAALEVRRQEVRRQLESDYDTYMATLKADIEWMQQQLDDVDQKHRERLIKAIEARQAELEDAKKRLQSRDEKQG